MNSNIFALMKKVQQQQLGPQLEKYAKLNGFTIGEADTANTLTIETAATRLEEAQEFMFAQLTKRDFEGNEFDAPGVDVNEAMNSSDASIIFPRVISNVLQEPREPNLFLSNSVADTITLSDNAPLTLEFPQVGALQAFDMSENQDYQTQNLSFTQQMTQIRLGKIGVGSSVSEEVLTHSMWPLLTLNLRLMKNAVDRKVESKLFTALTSKAQVVFNNQSTDSAYRTTGVGTSQSWNGSFAFDDLVKMLGVLLGNRYDSTHFLAHPLAWPMFAQDPLLRASFYHGGQLGAGIWTRMPQFDQQVNFPFGLTYVPYYALPYAEQSTLTGAGSSLGASLVSDLYVIDKSNSLFLATRGDTEMDQMDNWYRDCTQLKARRYVGVAAKDGGKGMVAAKNVRIVQNHSALFTIRTVTS